MVLAISNVGKPSKPVIQDAISCFILLFKAGVERQNIHILIDSNQYFRQASVCMFST